MQRNVTQSKKAVTNNRNLYYINLDICHVHEINLVIGETAVSFIDG